MDIDKEKRIIKFRRWNGNIKKMDYNGGSIHGIFDSNLHDYKHLDLNIFIMNIQNQFDIMQFIGVRDKNKKEIYEGDIVKVSGFDFVGYKDSGVPDSPYEEYQDIICPVSFSDAMFCFASENHGDVPLTAVSESLEVIGNIYENPELVSDNH